MMMVSVFRLNQETPLSMKALMAIFSILYIFWPLIFLFGFGGLFSKGLSISDRLHRFLSRTALGWLIWAFFLGFIYLRGGQPILLMPEKLDHLLFVISGGVLWGILIVWKIFRWHHRWIRLANTRKIEDLLNLSPEDFEALIAGLFRAYGHQALVTGGSSDHGVDVIVHTDKGEKWVVQCKRYSGSVGEPVVRDLYGTMTHEEAQKAYLITTGVFTIQAAAWAEGKPLILYDGEALVKLIRRTQKRTPKVLR
jgi:restriction system protein